MKLAAAYIRMSDDRQELSPQQQRDAIEERARQDGYAVVRWFQDEGKSGWKKRTRRPRFEAMMRSVTSGRLAEQGISRLYVWKTNRLGRRRVAVLQTLCDLEDAGIELMSLSENWPEDPKLRKAIQTLLALFDELYCDNLSEDVTRGMRSQATRGLWVYGKPPYGYRRGERAGEAQPLEIDPETAPVVKEIFALYLRGDGTRRIAEELTRRRIPPPSRKDLARSRHPKVWRSKHVRQILLNRAYTGALLFKEEVLCPDAHEALIAATDWKRAQRLRAERRRAPTKNPMRLGEKGLFTPWLRCGACGGAAMVRRGGSKEKPLFYYWCASAVDNRESCPGFSVRTDALDPKLLDTLQGDVLRPEHIKELIRASIERLRDTPDAALAERRGTLESEIRGLTSKIQNLLALAEGAGDGLDELGARLRELRSQRDTARAELAELPEPGPLPEPEEVDSEAFRQAVLAAWGAKGVPEKRAALAGLLDHVTLDPAGVATLHYAWKGQGVSYGAQSPNGPP